MKEVLTSGNWIITGVKQGYRGRLRINAKRRYPRADEPNLFSEWGTKEYINRIRREDGRGPVKITEY